MWPFQELKSREAARQRRRLDLEDGEGVLAEEPLKNRTASTTALQGESGKSDG